MALRERLEEPPPRGGSLAAAVVATATAGLEPGEGPNVVVTQAASPGSSIRSATVAVSLAPASSAESESRMPAWAVIISPSAQKVTPSP